jgi:transmembrane sensor
LSIPTQNRQLEYLHAEQASAWIEILRHPSAEQRAAFVAWLKESPLNVREFLLLHTLDQALDGLDTAGAYDSESLIAKLETQVVQLHRQPRPEMVQSSWNRRPWQWLGAAAALIVAMAIGWLLLARPGSGWTQFQTAVGEQRGFELEDGSVLQLNTQSHVALRYSKQSREIRLLAGEALFRVHHDPSRPFLVSTHDAVIRAVGTQFDVYQRRDDTSVAVLEGRVSIAPGPPPEPVSAHGSAAIRFSSADATVSSTISNLSVGANEEARISHTGLVNVQTMSDISETVAWQQRRLVFHQETLQRIVEEFNRYNHRQIRLEGDSVANRRYSGVFDVDDLESLTQILALNTGLSVKPSEHLIVVSARQ